MQVKDIDVDLYEFKPTFQYERIPIYISHTYIDSTHFYLNICVSDQYTQEIGEIQVLTYYRKTEISTIHTYFLEKNGDSGEGTPGSRTRRILIETPCIIEPSRIPTIVYPDYHLSPFPEKINKTSREEFNDLFSSEIQYELPSNIYAVGVLEPGQDTEEERSNEIYLYNTQYSSYFEIIPSIQFIVRVYLTFYHPTKDKKKNEKNNNAETFYFLICADDGYMEHHYSSYNGSNGRGREIPIIADFSGRRRIEGLQEKEYAILHRKKWIFAMSNLKGVPFTIDAIDRHYFYCNNYHPFRSFHRGIPFSQKENKIIFACRKHNSSKYNFLQYREKTGEMAQRAYFYTDAVSKENIVCNYETWIDSKEMMKYKYILDVDGNGCTWDATAWKLNSGSVIFKTESGWRQWFYDKYIPWVHYIPIADDFSDLQEKYHWCESNPDKCMDIINAAKDLFQEIYAFPNVVEYMREMIRSRILEL